MKRIAGLLTVMVLALAGCYGPLLPDEVNPATENLPPEVDLSGSTEVFLGDTISVELTATDPESDPLEWVFSLESVPAGSSLTTIGVDDTTASFTPDVEGVFVIGVSVSDGTNSVAATVTVTVVSGEPAAPSGPQPANNAGGVGIAAGLDWADADGATSYEVYLGANSLPTSATGTVSGSSFAPATSLAYSTTYYWQIVAVNGYGTTAGPVWQFTTQDEPLSPPAAPSGPSPSNGATDVSRNADLDWANAADAAGYNLQWRRAGDGWTNVNNLTSSSYALPQLDWDTTYQWRVTSTNAAGSAAGPTWSFTTIVQRPGSFSATAPANGATNQDVELQLDWSDSARAESYDLYFGTNDNPPLVATTDDSILGRSGLSRGTTYYWRVVAKNAGGTRSIGPFSFTTLPAAPAAPTGPSPGNGASGVSPNANLGWNASAGAETYQIFMGTNETPDTLVDTVATPSWDPGTLAYSQTYFWRVVATNAGGETESSIWSFTTHVEPPGSVNLLTPNNNETGVSSSRLRLDWEDSPRATAYDLYVGAGSLPGSPTATVSGQSYYDVTSLSLGTEYLWRVVARNAGGSTASATRSFTTELPAPAQPTSPSPADGATDALPDLSLDWANAANATSYDVYLKTNRSGFTRIATGITSSRFTPSDLAFNSRYEWYVVARNAERSTTGAVWTFTTQSFNLGSQDGGYWTFDGVLGDSSGFGHHGDWRPAPSRVDQGTSPVYTLNRNGEERKAVALNAAYNQYVVIPMAEHQNSPLLNHTNGFSLSLWYREFASNSNALLVTRANPKAGYELVLTSGQPLEWIVDGETITTIPTAPLQDGWNHVVISWDFESELLRIWANGTLVRDTKAAPFTNSSSDIYFGGSVQQGSSFTGALDDIRIYYRAISETEARALFEE